MLVFLPSIFQLIHSQLFVLIDPMPRDDKILVAINAEESNPQPISSGGKISQASDAQAIMLHTCIIPFGRDMTYSIHAEVLEA